MDASVGDESSLLDVGNLAVSRRSMNDPDRSVENRSSGAMPAKFRTMRDYEQQLYDLKKDNFHLRVRLFFMQQQVRGGQCSAAPGGELEAFKQHVQRDVETLIEELEKKNKMLEDLGEKIGQQHEVIEELKEEKEAAVKQLTAFQRKAVLAGAVHEDHAGVIDTVSELEQQKIQLEKDVKALRQRVGELEEHEVPNMRKQLEKCTTVIQSFSVQLHQKDKAIEALEAQVSLLSSTKPLTDTFLENLDKSLASSDVDSAVAARDQFKHDFSSITSRKRCSSDVLSAATSAMKARVNDLEAELRGKEATIESLDTDLAQLKSALRASREQCRDLEDEMERSTQVHMRICAEKDKLLESLQCQVHQLEDHAQEVRTLKNRHSALERECNSLHAAINEKSKFIEELLAERNKAVFETEKSFQELIHSMRQKDECIEVLQNKLKETGSEPQHSAIASQGQCSLLDSMRPDSDNHIHSREAQSFNLIELSVGEECLLQTQDTTKDDTENLEAPNQGSFSKLSPQDRTLFEELSEFYDALCRASQDIEVLSEVRESRITREESSNALKVDFLKELKSALQHVCERGFCLVTKTEAAGSSAMEAETEHKTKSAHRCDGDQLDPALSEKLGEILTVLSVEPIDESSRGWQIKDLLSHLDSFLLKIRSSDSELSQCPTVKENETGLLEENKLLRKRLLDSLTAIMKIRCSEQEVRTELTGLKEELLKDLAPMLECVNVLREEVDNLSVPASATHGGRDRKSTSIEELVYMVDDSGRLVPVPESAVPSPEPVAFSEVTVAKDAIQQTEDVVEAEEIEQLRNELNKARAQVKFLQKSLKESFSVRMSDSTRPLIEIDQNRPITEGSPNKSANRRWRKQLTNQKMSEFGLSENVFELQEEIFFLVLRIEDLERQLGRGPSSVLHDRSEKQQMPTLVSRNDKTLQERNDILEQQVQDMQEASAALLCRLEELAAFLEQLLRCDESGAFGSISLPPDTVARMRKLVADSRDFSLSMSQSILGGSDTGSVLSEHSALRAAAQKELPSLTAAKMSKTESKTKSIKKISPKDIPPQDEDVIFMEEELTRLREQVQQQQTEIFELSRRLNKDVSSASAIPDDLSQGRGKRTSQSTRGQLQRLEKLLRRMQGCSAKLEDALASHKELCQKMLDHGNSDTSRESVEQVQLPSSELIESHIQTMRKLQFKLEETVINNELLREILTERVESGSIIKTEAISTSASSPEVEVAQKLQQYSKELECKERREEILKRAIAHEQAAKLQLEKELLESHKELQALHDAHSKLEENFKQYGTMPNTGFDTHLQATLREVQDWNLRLQKENEDKSRRACELEAVLRKLQAEYAELTADLHDRDVQLESANKEVMNLRSSGNHGEIEELKAVLNDRVSEIEEISCTVKALNEEIARLRSEKMVLSHKLEATHKDHEILVESSSNKISELVTKLGPLSLQNKNQLDEIRSLKEVNASLQAELDVAVSKLDALHQELETLDFIERENQNLKDSIHMSKNQEISLRDKLQQVVREFQLLHKASEESRRSEVALKEETENLSTKVLKLTTQVEELEAESEELRAELQHLESEHGLAQEKEWKAREQGKELEQMVDELQRELQGTRSKLEDMETRCAQLEKELSASDETQQQLVSTNRELQMLLESKSEQLRAIEASNCELQQSLIQQSTNKGLERKHVMAFQELEDKNRSLQNQVVELRAKVDQVCHHKSSSLEVTPNDRSHPQRLSGRHKKSPPRSSHEIDDHQAHYNAPSIQEAGSLCHSRSHHTSPDLGIDSDPTPEREDANDSSPIAGGFEEHWQHRMGANWSGTSVHSAPNAVGICSLCQHQGTLEGSLRSKHNWTYAGEALDHLMDESPSKNVFPVICSAPSMRMCAVVQLMDHELLKKRVDESICLVRRLEGTTKQLLDILMELAPEFDEASDSKGLLQDALSGCHKIKVCLGESFRLICSFTISPMPDAKDDCHQRCCYENKQLKDELSTLNEKHAKQCIELQNALDQISTFKEKKEGMERAISRQLNKTKMVLKQTKGNLNVLRSRDSKQDRK